MKMNCIAFTLCSNNYLAQAKTLGESLLKTNPDVRFIIGLTDRINKDVDYSFFEPFQIVPYDQIGVDFFDEMVQKYNIIEFNTSVKPFYFNYLFNTYGREALVYYLDPDLMVYGSFEEMNGLLLENSFVVTPHILWPQLKPSVYESLFLNVGVFNLGFIGISYSEESEMFLTWWQNRLRDHCYINFSEGLFVDQLWVNFLPLLFRKAHILRSPGYNMAYWNFNERKILLHDGKVYVNDVSSPLIFYHFSGFDPNNAKRITKDKHTSTTTDDRPDVAPLIEEYTSRVKQNRFDVLSKVKPLLPFRPIKVKRTKWQNVGFSLKVRTNRLIKTIFNV